MSANVVFAISEALATRGISALRFNFRGVRNSGGTFSDGVGEKDDVRAALTAALAAPGVDGSRIGLVGYSFGGRIAVAVAAGDPRTKLVALVAPALFRAERELLRKYPGPVYLIIGDADQLIPPEMVLEHFQDKAGPRYGEVIPGPDHFWVGFEEALAQKVAGFFESGFRTKVPQEGE